jgi:hypothetical protein
MAAADDSTLENDDGFCDWERRVKLVESAILQAPAVAANLSRLKHAGADTESMLRLLALNAENNDMTLMETMRKRARQLLRLSQSLDQLATQIEETFAHPLTFSAVWWAFLMPTEDPFPDLDGLKRFPSPAIARMRELSKALYWEDRRLRKLSSIYPNLMEKWGISALLHIVQRDTGKFHDEVLADLLQSAHQARGSTKVFSGEILRKFRQRHARRLLRPRTSASQYMIGQMLGIGLSRSWDNPDGKN